MTCNLPTDDLRQLIPVKDAIGATWHRSRRAFYDWRTKFRVPAYRHGMYRRSDLDEGLALEERLHGVRRNRRR